MLMRKDDFIGGHCRAHRRPSSAYVDREAEVICPKRWHHSASSSGGGHGDSCGGMEGAVRRVVAVRDDETRLLGLSLQAGVDAALEVVEQFEAAHGRTEDVEKRMDAWLDAHTH